MWQIGEPCYTEKNVMELMKSAPPEKKMELLLKIRKAVRQ